MLATIDKRVAGMGIGEAFNHGILHRDLVKIVIQKRGQHEIPSPASTDRQERLAR